MKITYENKNKIGDLSLHDFNVTEFIYNDLDKNITMKLINNYISEKLSFKFSNIKFCEITGEKCKGGIDIIDWYELPETNEFSNEYEDIKPVGIALIKASWDTIKIYCEAIEVEGKPEIIDYKLRWQNNLE